MFQLAIVAGAEGAEVVAPPLWLQIGALVGTMVAGIAAAFGARYAAVAARNSANTSREAAEALAIAIKPSLAIRLNEVSSRGEGSYPAVSVTNDSDWDAHDVEVEVMTDGGRITRHKMHIILAARNRGEDDDESFDVRIPDPALGSPAPHQDDLSLWVTRVRITFWDHRHIAQYELIHAFDFEESEDGEGYGGEERVSERKIR